MTNAYQVITNRIISALEKGTVPWHRPWKGPQEHPRNLVSERKYRGINAFVLSLAEFDSPYWLTFKQAKDRGGHVKKSQKGCPCIYWNWTEKENHETGKIEKKPFLKYYTVFNVKQCEKVPYPTLEVSQKEHLPIKACEEVVSEMPNPPDIKNGGNKAYYDGLEDIVQIPEMSRFDGPEFYYGVMFHELIHCTGHKSRLARQAFIKGHPYGSDLYKKEELIAEMGAAFLSGTAGIINTTIRDSAGYIQNWLQALKNDKRMVVYAAAAGQKAADYILGE